MIIEKINKRINRRIEEELKKYNLMNLIIIIQKERLVKIIKK